MTDMESSSRRNFLRATASMMGVSLATSMTGCSALSGGDGGNGSGGSSEITGNINIGDELQGTIEVVTHADIINLQTDHVGAYIEIANSGENDKSVNVIAEFFKDGEKVGEDSARSKMIPTDSNAELRLGIRGTQEDIDQYGITIESAY